MRTFHELVRRAQGGDLAAFDSLVTRFRDMAVGYAYSVLRDFPLAEDAAQEAFVQAYKDLRSLRQPEAFPAWLRRIVFKHCDRLSRRKTPPLVALESVAEAPDARPDPLRDLERRERREAVLEGVLSLPRHERAAISLFYIDGYSMAEVGRFLEVPAATVKSRLHSARRRLKERTMERVRKTLRSCAPGDELNQRVRQVLTGVPEVSYQLHRTRKKDGLRRCPESHPFPSCVRACLEYLGEDLGFTRIEAHGKRWRLDTTYVHLMGTTGAAFRLSWKPGWHLDNPDLAHLSDDPLAAHRRGLLSLGRDFEVVERGGDEGDEERFRERIDHSIRVRSCPVIARGVLGPPVDCLVTGFDESGAVLIGWSYFQKSKEFAAGVRFEPNGCFRRRGWFPDTDRLILLEERGDVPPARQVYRDALEWALRLGREPVAGGDHHNGLAAYSAWAEAIAQDAEFVGCKKDELRLRYHVHQDAVGVVAEGRWYAHNFVSQVLADVEAPEVLAEAARHYDEEHTLMWKVWALVGGPGDSDQKARRFADPEVRRQTAEIIRQAREQDRLALDAIEQALARW